MFADILSLANSYLDRACSDAKNEAILLDAAERLNTLAETLSATHGGKTANHPLSVQTAPHDAHVRAHADWKASLPHNHHVFLWRAHKYLESLNRPHDAHVKAGIRSWFGDESARFPNTDKPVHVKTCPVAGAVVVGKPAKETVSVKGNEIVHPPLFVKRGSSYKAKDSARVKATETVYTKPIGSRRYVAYGTVKMGGGIEKS